MARSLPRCIGMLHWNEESSKFDNQALAAGFSGLGPQSSFAGSAVNVQFMVKDSKNTPRPEVGVFRLYERQIRQ
jgi:hypothetical protein